MSMQSTFCTLLGATALAVVSASASAGSVTVNGTSGAATGVGAIKKSGITVSCNVTFNVGGTAATYPIPPATQVGQVVSGSFTPGSTLCSQVTLPNTPWAIQANSVAADGKIDVTFKNVTFRTQALGDCGPNDLAATYDPASNMVTFPAFTMTGVNPAGSCTSSGLTLTVAPAGLITSTP